MLRAVESVDEEFSEMRTLKQVAHSRSLGRALDVVEVEELPLGIWGFLLESSCGGPGGPEKRARAEKA